MEWCMLASLLLNTLAILVIIAKKDPDGYIMSFVMPFILAAATALFITGLDIYEEPQRIREKAVEAGVGKFKADEKGKVSFYFIRHDGTEVKYENVKIMEKIK